MQRLGHFVLKVILLVAFFEVQSLVVFSKEHGIDEQMHRHSWLMCESDASQKSYDALSADLMPGGVNSQIRHFRFISHLNSFTQAVGGARTITTYRYLCQYFVKCRLFIERHCRYLGSKSCSYYIFALRRILV